MKDIIQDRLNKVNNLSDRRLLRDILYDVYGNVIDYNMDMYDKLEKRIYDEIPDPLDKFYIYTSLDILENIDPISDFLHPILTEDLSETRYNMEEIHEKLKTGEPLILASIFMQCDILAFQEILQKKKTYKGYVKTEKDIYQITVSLKRCERYIQEIEKLYRIFQLNGVEWSTINCPYAYKFVDIVLSSQLAIKPGEKITEISIDLAEYERYKVINAVPLWNIKQIIGDDKSFPMPAKDRINYDHMVALEDLGTQNGYLVGLDNEDYIYCKRLENDLVIISSNSDQHSWNLLQIENVSNVKAQNFLYELLSNKRNLGFAGRYASVKSMVIRTKGEISRLLKSYEISKELDFVGVEIRESYNKPNETVNFNDFIDDNIRVDAYKKVMLLTFRGANREGFLALDKMSFLVSEIQVLFPEYKCIGELV